MILRFQDFTWKILFCLSSQQLSLHQNQKNAYRQAEFERLRPSSTCNSLKISQQALNTSTWLGNINAGMTKLIILCSGLCWEKAKAEILETPMTVPAKFIISLLIPQRVIENNSNLYGSDNSWAWFHSLISCKCQTFEGVWYQSKVHAYEPWIVWGSTLKKKVLHSD